MYLYHIIVWVAYCSSLVKCDVINVTYTKTWDEAVDYCKTKHKGTLSSVTEIREFGYTDWENVWTMSSTLTKWLSFIGCFHIADKETKMTYDLNFDGTKRCSEICDTSEFIGISAKRRCVCLPKMVSNKINWKECHLPKNESHYIVYRKYGATISNVSDPTLNCGAVRCNQAQRKRYFYPENCRTELKFLCELHSSKRKLDWTKGIQHCLKKDESPHSFGNYCQKSDGLFRQRGNHWIGMNRPLDHDKNPFKECTFWSNNEEAANCTRSLPFFCTGEVVLGHPPTQSPMHPTSADMSGIISQPQGVLIGVSVALAVSLLLTIVVVIILCRRTKKNAQSIKLVKQQPAQEQNQQVQMKMNLHSQEGENTLENIYELIDIDDDNKKDNKSMPRRDLTVKCPLLPEVMRSTSQASGNSVSTPCNLPVSDRPESQGNRCLVAETAGPCLHVSSSAAEVDGHYDSLNSTRPGNDVASDMYDHAKIVNVSERVVNLNPDSLPSDINVQQPSKMDNNEGVYDFAKGVENEYDEFKTPNKHVDTTDTYDHVFSNLPS